MSLAPWIIEYRKHDLSESDSNKFDSYPKVVKGAYQTLLKEEFKKIRDKETVMVDPDLKAGEVMAFQSSHYRHSFVLWSVSYKEPELLSKADIDLFTDLVLDCRKFESEYIGQEMLEQDPVYQMLKHLPVAKEAPTTSTGGYVFAPK